ncbi:MFS transporter [Tessaracoccus massiliensis]|uniref:MFS transporter n=1 Tax=Tessaracoccus massiliensis TaxID=1522311 RepID=UPI001119C91C|nr:MFS transporter [Tessaracoccus massiliensis]
MALILVAQLAARFPAGMYTLGILMHVERQQGTYTAAGLVLAAFSAGMAIAGPPISRLLSRFGTLPVLSITLVISVTAFILLAVFPTLPLPWLIVLGVLGGAAMPPVIPAVRTLYPRITPQHMLTSLFSFDAALQEIIWVIGPVAITMLVAAFGTTTALLVVVGIQVLGGLMFILAPAVRSLKIPPATRKLGRVLQNPSVVLMMVTSALFLGAFAAVEAGVVASFDEGSIRAGVVLGIASVGSLIGGLATGNRPISRWSLAIRTLIMVVGLTLAGLLSGFWGLSVALFIAGIGIAPALAAVSAVIAGSVSFSDTAEAYGWIGTGQLLGTSICAAAGGIAIDAVGASGAMYVAAGTATLALIVAVLFRKAQPDLRGGISILD